MGEGKRARVCGGRCHGAKRAKCACWCGGLFHGKAGEAAREAFRQVMGDVPKREADGQDPGVLFPAAMQAALNAGARP